MLVVSEAMSRRRGTVVDDDVLFRFRLRLFSLAEELGQRSGGPPPRGRPPVHVLRLAADCGEPTSHDAVSIRDLSLDQLTNPHGDYLLALATAERAVLVSGDVHLAILADRLPVRTPADFLASLDEPPS